MKKSDAYLEGYLQLKVGSNIVEDVNPYKNHFKGIEPCCLRTILEDLQLKIKVYDHYNKGTSLPTAYGNINYKIEKINDEGINESRSGIIKVSNNEIEMVLNDGNVLNLKVLSKYLFDPFIEVDCDYLKKILA